MGKRLDAFFEGLLNDDKKETEGDSVGPKTAAVLNSLTELKTSGPFSETLPQGVAGPVRNDLLTANYRRQLSREEKYGTAGGNIELSSDFLPAGTPWKSADQYMPLQNEQKYTILEEGGKAVIIPRVDARRGSPQLTDREAVDLYHETGRNYGTFDNYDAARTFLTFLQENDRARQSDAGTLNFRNDSDRDALFAELDKRDLQKKERAWRESFGNADNNFLQAAALAGASGFNTTVTGLANINPMLRNNRDFQNQSKAINNVSAEERQQIGEKSAVLGTAYDLWQNFAMNAPAMAAGAATGAPIVGSAVIFASSFGNDLKYAEEGGHDPGRAYAYAFLDGLNQALLDYVGNIPGISKIGETLTKNIKNPVLKFLGDVAEEGFTEDMQSVVENGLKNIILGEMNDASPFSEEAMYSALLGALSAGLLNGPQVTLEAKRTAKVGKEFLDSPGGITNLWVLGLSNPKSSEEYQTTVKLKEKTERTGKMPSAYQVGALVLQCQSETAMTAREIDTAVRESAANTGVAAETAEAVAAVSTRFSKKVGFVPTNAAILQTENGAAAGAYDSETDTVFINAAIKTDTAVQFVLKHELTHGIEKTSMWKSLRRVARQQMGDAAFDAEVSRIRVRRAAVGEALDAAGAEKEVVANFVGNNLFTENFAEAITRQDTELSSVFAGTFYRLRYAMDAIKNGKQAARMQYAERLFTAALDKTPGTVHLNADADTEGEVQYSLKQGAEQEVERVLNGENLRNDIQLTESSPAIIVEQKGARDLPLVMKATHIRENIFTEEEARQKGLKTGKNIHYHGLGKDLFLQVIDGLNDVTVAYRGTKNATMPNRRENYFLLVSQIRDGNGNIINVPVYINQVGQYNSVVMDANRVATVYGDEDFYKSVQEQVRQGNLVRIKRRGIKASERLEDIPSGYSNNTSSDTTVSQNTGDVNSQYMQNSEKDTQRAGGNVQHSIEKDENGNAIVKSDREVLSGNDRNEWRRQVSAFFNDALLKDGSLTVESTEGQTLQITKKETLHKNRDRYKQEKGKRVLLSDNEFFVKMQALSHVDELAQAAEMRKDASGNVAVWEDTKNHPFATDGFVYADVLFEDADGARYTVTMSIGMKNGVGTVYNVGKIKGPMQRQTPQKSMTSDRFVGSRGENSGSMHTSVSDITVSQDRSDVNSQYMQNSENDARGNTQHAFADDADGGVAVEEKTEKAPSSEESSVTQRMDELFQQFTDGEISMADYDAALAQITEDAVFENDKKHLKENSDIRAERQEARRGKNMTKFQKAQAEERGRLLWDLNNKKISKGYYDAALRQLVADAVAENERKWESGKRGSALEKEQTRRENAARRDAEQKARREAEQQERREKTERRDAEWQARREAEEQARREQREAAEEKKTHDAAKSQAMKDMHELEERLKNPQKRRYIAAEDTQHVLDLLRAITIAEGDERQYIAEKEEKRNNAVYPATQSRYDNEIRKAINSGEATSAKLDHLRLLYKNLLNSDLLKTAYSSEIDARLGAFIEKVKGKAFSDFTTEELKELSAIVHSYLYTTEKALKFPAEVFGEEKEVSEAMPTLLNELEQNASKMPRALRNLVNLHMDVKRVFAGLFGGYHKDSWWRKVGEYLDGRGKMEVSVENDFRECFASVAGKEDIQRLSLHGKKDLVDVGLVDKNGKPVLVTRGMMVLLHMHINNAANIHALVENKFLVPDFNGYYRDGGKQSYIDGTLATVADSNIKEIEQLYLELQDAGKAEKEDLQYRYDELISKEKSKWYAVGKTIESLMTEDEKKFEKSARVWWNEKQKEYINKTSMVLDGYPKALSDDYVPIHRQSTMLHHDVETVRVDRRLENAGMLKSRRAHSQVPILATDITTELREAVDFTKKYYAYAEPIKVLSKILDYTNLERTDSTRERLGKTFGKSRSPLGVSGEELLANLIADLNGARKSSGSAVDKFFGVVRNNTVRAVMSLNPRVALSQFSAVPQIVSCISGNSFSKGVPRAVALLFKRKEARVAQNKLMSKYSAAWASRSANNSAGMEEIVAAKEGNTFIDRAYRWADDKTHGAINLTGKADAIATGAIIWFGCEEEIKTTHPELKVGSEEFYKAVGELQDQVIYETQPDEHIMNRSEIQRQPGVLSKLVTLFGSPGFKTYNQFMNAYQEMVVYSKDQKEGKHGVTEADVKAKKEKFARVTAYSVIASQVLYATLRMAYNAMIHNLNGYRDDDGELNAGSIANAMGLEAISQIADLVPFGGQVYEVVAARVLGEKYYGLDDNALEAVGNILNDIANGNFKNPATYNKLIGDLSSALGIPYKNISSTVKGILYHAEDIKNGEFLSFRAGSGVGMTQTYRQLYKAMASGKTEKAQSLREYLLSSGKTAAEIESGIRAAIRSENTDAKKQAERAIEEAMTNMYFDSFTEKEQNRVESSLRSFYADKVFSKAGGDMTAANQKAEKAVGKGVPAADYFVAQVLKNARFADKNGDGKVTKAEYGTLVDEMDCTERVKQLLKNMK